MGEYKELNRKLGEVYVALIDIELIINNKFLDNCGGNTPAHFPPLLWKNNILEMQSKIENIMKSHLVQCGVEHEED